MRYERRLMNPEDIQEIVQMNLREMDKLEIEAGSGLLAPCALLKAVEMSCKVWVITLDSRIVGIFGVASNEEGSGNPWLLGTEEMIAIPRRFLRESKRIVEEMEQMFSLLWNYVCEENTAALEWLEFLGFTIGYDQRMKIGKLIFVPFTKLKE